MRAYFDHAATSPMTPDVLAAYTAELSRVGNPSSLHAAGQAARVRLETAREDLARALGARTPAEVIFTSGGTEADNLALKGIYWNRRAKDPQRSRILVSSIEHHAVLETAEWLEAEQGARITWLPVDRSGRLDLDACAKVLSDHADEIALVSLMLANNEIGTVQPVKEVAALAHRYGIPVHTDAVQALGHIPVDVSALGVDALSVSAHKIGGPVGVGALVLSRDLTATPVLHGGGQERSIRSGTLDVAGAVAFAAAAQAAVQSQPEESARLGRLRQKLVDGVRAAVPDAVVSGPAEATAADGSPTRLPGNAHFIFPGAEGDSLLFLLDAAGIDSSTGSACQAGVSRPSHVVLACGYPEDAARSTQRFTMGPATTEADVDLLITTISQVWGRAKAAGMVSATPAWMINEYGQEEKQ